MSFLDIALLRDVIRTKSVEKLPFPFISCSFVGSSLWYFYGLLIDDSFVQVPNAIGATLAASQLVLFIIYPSKQKSRKVN